MEKIHLEEDMKEKLAPIHTLQHNRIRIQENLEEFLIELFGLENLDRESIEVLGSRSTKEPLADQIDHDNIHGWLESHLISNEKRMAILARKIIDTSDEDALILAYAEFGKRLGDSLKADVQYHDTQELYRALSAVLLDGMPCDKISVLTEAGDDLLIWHNVRDIHGRYFEEQNLPAELFYTLRGAFMSSLVKSLGNLTYSLDFTSKGIENRVEVRK